MEIYRSAGAATIAALMARGRDDDFSCVARRCKRAVASACRDVRADGVEDERALRACTKLYRMLHPESSPGEAHRLVAAWVERHFVVDIENS